MLDKNNQTDQNKQTNDDHYALLLSIYFINTYVFFAKKKGPMSTGPILRSFSLGQDNQNAQNAHRCQKRQAHQHSISLLSV